MLKLIKRFLGIAKIEKEMREIEWMRDFLKQYARADADVGFRGNNTIVLTGLFRGKAYVQFYDLGNGEFMALVEQLRQMKRQCLIRHVDAPPDFLGQFDLH